MKKNVFILGSTGVGKSALALKISKQLNASHNSTAIINADSLQLYKGLDIGTAKPSAQDMLDVPHLLFDCMDYPKEATVAWYYKNFFSNLDSQQYKNFLVVGGSGFYIRALESGLYPEHKISTEIKKKYEDLCKQQGPEVLHKILITQDLQSSKSIHHKDSYRLIRALSVIEASGKKISEIKKTFDAQKKDYPYLLKKVGLFVSREELRTMLVDRIKFMIKTGFIKEVKDLLKNKQQNWKPLFSVGYKEVQMYLQGHLDKTALENLILQSTMALAKRQSTWFKKDKNIQWFHAVKELKEAEKSICNFLQKG